MGHQNVQIGFWLGPKKKNTCFVIFNFSKSQRGHSPLLAQAPNTFLKTIGDFRVTKALHQVKKHISKWNLGFGVLEHSGTTWEVSKFFSWKITPPYRIPVLCHGLSSCNSTGYVWFLCQILVLVKFNFIKVAGRCNLGDMNKKCPLMDTVLG